jgi:Aminotransferase class-III
MKNNTAPSSVANIFLTAIAFASRRFSSPPCNTKGIKLHAAIAILGDLTKMQTSCCNSSFAPTHPDEPVPKEVSETLARHARYTLNTYARPPIIFQRGQGCKVWDTQGREYLDMSAGIAVNALGHGDRGVADVLHEQASAA